MEALPHSQNLSLTSCGEIGPANCPDWAGYNGQRQSGRGISRVFIQ